VRGIGRDTLRAMPENRFVGDVARTYDRTSDHMFASEVLDPAVDCLASLAGGGPVLEFAIGTGRVALALARRGLDVTGIELSADMLAELRRAPGSELIHVIEEQVACFENAARHLAPGGRFVIENGVPALRRLPPGAIGVPFTVSDDYVGIDDFSDRTHSRSRGSRHFHRTVDGTFREFSAPFRYVWPSELDLMARIAGLTLEHRWAGWDRSPFTGDSPSHVSVWS
jgi:SAM-dependent methyltransferase